MSNTKSIDTIPPQTLAKLRAVTPEQWSLWQQNKTPIREIMRVIQCDHRRIAAYCEHLGIRWWRPQNRLTDEQQQAIAHDIETGVGVHAICRKHGVTDDTVARIRRIHKLPYFKHKRPGRRTIEAVPPEQWNTWRSERWSTARIARTLKVSRMAITKFISDKGWKWPVAIPERRSKTAKPRPSRAKFVRSFTARSGPQWTRQDYADLCDKEFALPHYLRKAPEMLRQIEAREAQERMNRSGSRRKETA